MSRQKKQKAGGGRKQHSRSRLPRNRGTEFHPVQGVSTFGSDDAAPMPPAAAELVATPMNYEGEAVTLHVPSGALLKVLEIAVAERLEHGLGIEPRRVDPEGQHALTQLTRITGEDGTDFVRAMARVFVRPDPARAKAPPTAWQGWIDLPTRYVGMMLEASQRRDRQAPRNVQEGAAGRPEIRTMIRSRRPRWQGSYTFDKVYDRQVEITSQMHSALMRADDRRIIAPARVVMGAEAVEALDEAHLIRVEADQVELLPDWEEYGDAWDFASDAHLPFDPLYFEFEGPGGVAPVHAVTLNLTDEEGDGRVVLAQAHGAMVLRGALMWRGESSNLTVEPFGDVYVQREGESVEEARERPSLIDARSPAGRVIFGHTAYDRQPGDALIGHQRLVAVDDQQREVAEAHPLAIDAGIYTNGEIPGVVVLPFGDDDVAEVGWTPEDAVAWGAIVLSMAARSLACLSILESEAVVVEDAPIEVRDRKRAEKRGWQIAQQVFVRPTRKGPRREAVPGHEREYSHRFWVSGHYKHFPLGTQTADARPDLVKPCTRMGEASCGVCRRVWTPPFIKGPDDKPIVIKALVKKRERHTASV